MMKRIISSSTSFLILFFLVQAGHSQTWQSIMLHDTLLKVELSTSKKAIHLSDPFEIEVKLLNAGKAEIVILSQLWLEGISNTRLEVTDNSGKEIKGVWGPKFDERGYINDTGYTFAPDFPPSNLLLNPSEFWGTKLFFDASRLPKPGVYYFQITYFGCSPNFIKRLIKEDFIRKSDIRYPLKKYWSGEVKSNKMKIIVKK